jgi:hypothetical protein
MQGKRRSQAVPMDQGNSTDPTCRLFRYASLWVGHVEVSKAWVNSLRLRRGVKA